MKPKNPSSETAIVTKETLQKVVENFTQVKSAYKTLQSQFNKLKDNFRHKLNSKMSEADELLEQSKDFHLQHLGKNNLQLSTKII